MLSQKFLFLGKFIVPNLKILVLKNFLLLLLSFNINNRLRFYWKANEFLDVPTEVLRESLKQTEMAEKRAEKVKD